MQKLRENVGLVETPWLRAEAKNEQVWLEVLALHFREFLRGFYDRLLKKTKMVSYVKWAQVTEKYRFH